MWEKAFEVLKVVLSCGFELSDSNYNSKGKVVKHYKDMFEDYSIIIDNELVGYLSFNEREIRGMGNFEIPQALKILKILLKNP